MNNRLHSIFLRENSQRIRTKFLSRLFGIFSEEIVSLWASDSRSPYQNLGRPTIKTSGSNLGHTLDFTFRERATGKTYVVEMKCEIEYQNFKYFVLEKVEQLDHHKKPAFAAFLSAAKFPSMQTVQVAGKPIEIDGAILIWGSATSDGCKAVMEAKGFRKILTIDEICDDLASWRHEGYLVLIGQRQEWCSELFSGLISSRENPRNAEPLASNDWGVSILEVGTEGGSLTLSGMKSSDGAWEYMLCCNDVASLDTLPEEEQTENPISNSAVVKSWSEALELLNKYEVWHRFFPLTIHEDFEDRIIGEVRKRGGDEAVAQWEERFNWRKERNIQ